MKRDGSILTANLNIAHTKDGRNLLYDINKITVIGHGVVPSDSKKSRGSHINTNNGKNRISQQSSKSNTPDVKKPKDDTIYADYLSAVERGETETARHMVDAAAKAMKRIAEGVRQFMDDVKAPEQMAKLMSENAEAGQKNNTSGEVRYSKGEVKDIDRGYRSYQNIDLNTLDDKEIKVYNDRGWAYDLFTDEDMLLLEEKFNLLNPKLKFPNEITLYDGSRIVEVNNKLVLIGGKFNNPYIYHVLAINTKSESVAEDIKEFIFDVIDQSKVSYREYYCQTVTMVSGAIKNVHGAGFVRVFENTDYEYRKGASSWQRATLPNNFNHFGYTAKFQDRTGDNSEAQRRKTDVKNRDTRYSKDDTIYDYITSEYGDAKSTEDKCLRFDSHANLALWVHLLWEKNHLLVGLKTCPGTFF